MKCNYNIDRKFELWDFLSYFRSTNLNGILQVPAEIQNYGFT